MTHCVDRTRCARLLTTNTSIRVRRKTLSILFSTNVTGRLFPLVLFVNVNTVVSFKPLLSGPGLVVFNTTTRFNVFFALDVTHLFNFRLGSTTSVNVVNTTSNPASVIITRGLRSRCINTVVITTCSCVTLIPVVRPPIVGTVAAGGRHLVHVPCRRGSISGNAHVVFPVIVATVTNLFSPTSITLMNFLVFNGLVHRYNILGSLSSATRGILTGLVAVFLNVAVTYHVRTSRFLHPRALLVLNLNLFTFVFSAINNIVFTGLLGLFSGGGVGPVVNTTNVSTFPVSTHIIRGVNLRRSDRGFLLVRSVNIGISNRVTSIVTNNLVVDLIDWRGKRCAVVLLTISMRGFISDLPLVNFNVLNVFVMANLVMTDVC